MFKVTHKVKKTGDAPAEAKESVEKQFSEQILADCKGTPDRFEGRPFYDTGHLVESLVLRLTGAKARGRSGIIGRVVAPADRLNNRYLLGGFRGKIADAWRLFGIGHSKGGR